MGNLSTDKLPTFCEANFVLRQILTWEIFIAAPSLSLPPSFSPPLSSLYSSLSLSLSLPLSPQAERARQEALASFGGTDLASVAVRKRDLREELRRDAKLLEQGETCHNRVKHKTRYIHSTCDSDINMYLT